MIRSTTNANGTITVWCSHCDRDVAYTLSFGQPEPGFPGADQCFHCAAGEPIACAIGEICDCRYQRIRRAQIEWSIKAGIDWL